MILLVVPTTVQQVIAFVVLGLAAVPAGVVWRVSEYRVYRSGPVTSTGSTLWLLVYLAIYFVLARVVGWGGTYFASVAGFSAGMAIGLPLMTYATALSDPPPAPSSVASVQPSLESNQADRDRAGPADGPRT